MNGLCQNSMNGICSAIPTMGIENGNCHIPILIPLIYHTWDLKIFPVYILPVETSKLGSEQSSEAIATDSEYKQNSHATERTSVPKKRKIDEEEATIETWKKKQIILSGKFFNLYSTRADMHDQTHINIFRGLLN